MPPLRVGERGRGNGLRASCSEAIGGGGKMPRGEAEPLGRFLRRQLRRLCRAGFFPMASLMIGLPGERDEHVQETLAWVESLGDERLAVFPVLYAPVDGTPAARSAAGCGPCTGR